MFDHSSQRVGFGIQRAVGRDLARSVRSDSTMGSAGGTLVFPRVGIAGPVAAILALLAAGAYLVREGYRRNSRHQIP